jgi:uncharacterized protein YdiU (UPF0061 family)
MNATFDQALGQRFASLSANFYRPVSPTPLPDPRLVHLNRPLAEFLGLDSESLSSPESVALLTGSAQPMHKPIASVYAGHQFGVWVPQLGDGRALLLGDVKAKDDELYELQLKGAGLTPFSRTADGRAVLRSSIREYLCSEAMAGLGIPTTRALSITASPEPVYRETVETAAVVTRVAPSFVRFGHFEFFYHHGDHDALRELADFVIKNYYPQCLGTVNPYVAFLGEVVARTARLMADWQAVGFCHGVMNTDNMSVLGLTLDYGPFGFLDEFDVGHICNHSDYQGRYAYGRQPQIGLWNLQCFAATLLPFADQEALIEQLRNFQKVYEAAYLAKLRAKLGLLEEQDNDGMLAESLLMLMHANKTDYTIFFRALSSFDQTDTQNHALRDLIIDREEFDEWAVKYRERLQSETRPAAERAAAMNRVNPKYVLRNHLVEIAIRKARDEKDYSEVDRLFRCLQRPFDEQSEFDAYAAFPPEWASELSVSCSS